MIKNSIWSGYHSVSGVGVTGRLPLKATALKRCMVIDMGWYRNAVSLMSPVTAVRRLPISPMRVFPSLLIGPNVSHAMGVKAYWLERPMYLLHFLIAAFSAALPAVVAVIVL